MLLLQYSILAGLLLRPATAVTITTPTIIPRATTSLSTATTTSAIEFMTTIYNVIPGQTNDHVTLAGQTIAIAVPTCIQTITPDKNGYVPPGTCGALYDYYPSFAAAVVFAILFGILTVAHIAQAAVFKKVRWDPGVSRRSKKLTRHPNLEILLGTHHGLYLGDDFLHSSIDIYQVSTE